MNSRDQFLKTVNHEQTNRIVMDFGATPVTGIHIQTISKLRRHFGLQRKPIRVIEPFQMLGEVGWELIDSIGIDVIGVWGKNNMFGFHNHAPYKEWKTPWGQRVMVPLNFNTTIDENGDLLMYPEGDTSVGHSAKMPKAAYFFDAVNRQGVVDDSNLNPEDNLEEFSLMSDTDLSYWKEQVGIATKRGKGLVANFGGTAIGDIALVPGLNLKAPKGIRDVSDWYMSTLMRSDYLHQVFEKQTDKIGRAHV